MKRVILTGGTGFVGTNLTRRLINEGHEVHLLLRQSYNPWRIESILKEINIHIIDLSNPTSLLEVIDNIQPDWVFHLAAYGAYSSQLTL
jgi:nucleoside-diphosphate-sugar epimerase